MVFVGLVIEKEAEDARGGPKHAELSEEERKFIHRKSEIGWKVLMIGIGIEIVIGGGLAAHDVLKEKETADEMAQNDPLNQPVSDVSAVVIFHLKTQSIKNVQKPLFGAKPGYLLLDTTNLDLGKFDEFCSLECKLGDASYSQALNSGDPNFADLMLEMNFHLWPRLSAKPPARIGSPIKISDIMKNVNILKIDAVLITNSAEVIGGHVELILNGGVRKEFEIPPQINGTNEGFGNCLEMIATNVIPQIR